MVNSVLNEVGMVIQNKFRFIPIVFGDLGLEKRLKTKLDVRVVNILIPNLYLTKHWVRVHDLMLSRSFTEVPGENFTFIRNGVIVVFSSMEEFKENYGISTKKLPRVKRHFTYYLPDLRQYYDCYNKRLAALPENSGEALLIKERISLIVEALKKQTIAHTREFLRAVSDEESLRCDYTHYIRVAQSCKMLSQVMGADEFICVMAAMLYNIDSVCSENSENYKIEKILKNEFVSDDEITAIKNTISELKSGNRRKSKEGKCLSDAYNLDYVGAVGIAMGFAEYGRKCLPMYPMDDMHLNNYEDIYREYRNTLEHFTVIKQRFAKMFYSDEAKRIAKDRMEYMQSFLYRFYDECEGIL